MGESEEIIGLVEEIGFEFNENSIEEFSRLFMEMFNDTRLHIHCGHTYNEIYGL